MSTHPPPRSIITRNRDRLACTECRRRKLKCDRESPCGACTRRNDEQSCVFQKFQSSFDHERERRVQAESRLQHLEELVKTLANTKRQPDPQISHPGLGIPVETQNSPSDAQQPHNPYPGATHWSAMLDDIEELRMMSADDGSSTLTEQSWGDTPTDKGISVLFGGGQQSHSLPDVLAHHLPARKDTDRLLSTYFHAQAVAAPFIHSPTFRKQYQAFWDNPRATSPLWTSMLFSICHIASSCLRPNNNNTPPYNNSYATAAAYCLVLGEYFRPAQFAPESALLFVQAQCLSTQILSNDIAVLMSHTVRIATVMGYHRDPSHGKWTPFQGEMRRRVWSLLLQLDLLISFHMGLPSNVQYPTWDTLPPRNVLDSELNEEMVSLPPARPDDFPSEIQFYNTKLRLMTVFEKIQRHTLSTQKDEAWFRRVKQLDAELRELWASFPSIYNPRGMSDSVLDTSHVIVTRLCVTCLYYKCLCVLHKPCVRQRQLESILVCLESSSGLVNGLLDAASEFKPGGQTETERWFMSALTWHDFLLGCTALCSVFCIITDLQFNSEGFGNIRIPDMVRSLEGAKDLCLEHASSRSSDTLRVASILEKVLESYRSAQPSMSESISSSDTLMNTAFPNGSTVSQDINHGLGNEIPFIQDDWQTFPTQGPLDDESWAFLQAYVDVRSILSSSKKPEIGL